jgi:hypothetical protein
MTEEKQRTEATYRAIKTNSSSSLKEFSLDRKKYYKKYVLGETVEDKDTQAATTGRVVETLLLEPQEFDGRFYMSSCASAPTGLMLAFVDALYKHTFNATNDNGEITREFSDIAKDAYVDSGFKIKFDAVIAKFVGSDAELYYNELRVVRGRGLTVVTVNEIDNAERIVQELRTNHVTATIVNLVNSARWTVLNQLQVTEYYVEGMEFKSMMDKVVIDHEKKTIQVYDLKCVWSVEGFYEDYYLYRRAYIQAYLYNEGIGSWASESGYGDYTIFNTKFIVCDSINYMNPLIYTISNDDMNDAFYGFEHKGRTYPGVQSLIENLGWAIENNVWNMSRENYLSNGVVNIKGGN